MAYNEYIYHLQTSLFAIDFRFTFRKFEIYTIINYSHHTVQTNHHDLFVLFYYNFVPLNTVPFPHPFLSRSKFLFSPHLKEKHTYTEWFTSQMPATAKECQVEARTLGNSTWVAETQLLGHYPLPPRANLSWKLESEAEPGSEPSHSDMEYGYPKCHHNHCAKHLPHGIVCLNMKSIGSPLWQGKIKIQNGFGHGQ